jgi:hypothetical protein
MALESVKGLGNKSVEFIYKRFQSINQIKENEHRAEIEKELGKARADALFAYLAQGYKPTEQPTESEES